MFNGAQADTPPLQRFILEIFMFKTCVSFLQKNDILEKNVPAPLYTPFEKAKLFTLRGRTVETFHTFLTIG